MRLDRIGQGVRAEFADDRIQALFEESSSKMEANGVAAGAMLLPLSGLSGKLGAWPAFLERNRGRRLLLYCQSGTRSGFAAARLRREGFDAVNLGTLLGWRLGGGKVVPPGTPNDLSSNLPPPQP